MDTYNNLGDNIYESIEQGKFDDPKMPQKPSKDCPSCGNYQGIHNNNNFCPSCGTEIKTNYQKSVEEYQKKIKDYRKQCMAQIEKFKQAALSYVGVPIEHPKANKLFNMAWNNAHSEGLSGVVMEMEELSELLTLG